MHRRCCRLTSRQHRRCIIPQDVTQSSAPEDGRNYRPKLFELIGIINKPLLFHLVGCLYYCISDAWSYKLQSKSRFIHRVTHKRNLRTSGVKTSLLNFTFLSPLHLLWKLITKSKLHVSVWIKLSSYSQCSTKGKGHTYSGLHSQKLYDV